MARREPDPMDESIIVRPGDSNEVETAKLMLQIDYYLNRNDLDHVKLLNVISCVTAGAVTANEVLSARE